jgi:hypothetical protein
MAGDRWTSGGESKEISSLFPSQGLPSSSWLELKDDESKKTRGVEAGIKMRKPELQKSYKEREKFERVYIWIGIGLRHEPLEQSRIC